MQRRDYVIISLAFLIVVGLWALTPLVTILVSERPENAGEVGDIFGSVNSLFTGLAFVALIATIILQSRELRQNTKVLENQERELKEQAIALQEQVRLMGLSAGVSALPTLIAQEKVRLMNMDSGVAHKVEQMPIERLQKFIVEREKELVERRTWLAANEEKAKNVSQKITQTGGASSAELHLLSQANDVRPIIEQLERSLPTLRRLHFLMEELEEAYKQIRRHPAH